MKKFFDSNLFYAILAVIMAVFLIFYVESAENPVTEKTFSNVNVAVTGLPANHILDAEPEAVEIRVSGNRSAVNLSLPRDVRAFVDLRNARPGTDIYPVQYTLPGGLSPVYVRPDTVELSIDELGALDLPVRCQTTNAVRQGYSNLDPVLSPASVTVSGPRRILDQIEEARVSVDLAERTLNYTADLPVLLLDKENHEFQSSRVHLSADTVNVHIPITENLSSKNVSVRTALSGNVDDRHIVAGVEVQPASVKITGSYTAVSGIEYLTTETIDLSPMTDTYHGFVRLVTPPGVSVLEGDMVELTIRVEKNLTRRTLAGLPIEVRGAPEDMAYGALPMTVDITLAAYPDVFDKATVGGELRIGVAVYVDLEGEPADTRDYPLVIEVPEDYLVTLVSEESVRLYRNDPI